MKSWKFGAMVLSMIAIAACGGETSTGTTSGNTGGTASTGTSAGGSGGGNGGATTGSMTSTGTETTTTSTTATGTTTSTTTTTSTGSTTSTGTGGGTCQDATDCSLCKAKDKTCVECCGKANPDAQKKFVGFLIGNCVCAAMAPCFTQCGGTAGMMPSVCTDPNTATQACVMCVNGLGANACVMKASQDCVGDAVCKDLATCQQSCSG